MLDAYSSSKEDKGLLRYVRRYLLPLSWCISVPMPTHDVTLHVSTSWYAHILLCGPACQLAYCTATHADKIFPHPVCRRLRVFAFQYSVTVGTSVMLTGRWLQAPHVLKCEYCTTVWRSHISVHLFALKLFGSSWTRCFNAPCRGGNLRPHSSAGAAVLPGLWHIHADLRCHLLSQKHSGMEILRPGLADPSSMARLVLAIRQLKPWDFW